MRDRAPPSAPRGPLPLCTRSVVERQLIASPRHTLTTVPLWRAPTSGIIVPILGIQRNAAPASRKSLADALFTKTQQRVLGALFSQPDRSLYASELIRTTGRGRGPLNANWPDLKPAASWSAGGWANRGTTRPTSIAAVRGDTVGIVLKTVGLAEPLRSALKPLSSSIRAAFVYGSVAKATDRATSDIDLIIVSDHLTYGEVFRALEKVTESLGRPINPTVYTAAEYSKRSREENAFVTRVLRQPRIWVIGGEDDLPIAA